MIDSFLELREGDYVVHLSHGIGRYLGLKLLEKEDQAEEHLELEFHGGTKIYVPTSKIDLVQKYVAGRKAGRRWPTSAAEPGCVRKRRPSARDRPRERHARPAGTPRIAAGFTFPDDSEWQKEFDASFPYTETPDQLTAIAAIKADMRAPRPLDRLICGDVGYGKTELAMRAAFKAVDAGYQVAVLVPTTVLAEQHGRTFAPRMADSRFRSACSAGSARRRKNARSSSGLADGSVDIVIGTHRLAQADIHFENLGLLVIDEEQRFGVDVKERLKALRTHRRRTDDDRHANPAHLAHVAVGAARYLEPGNASGRPAGIETRVARSNAELIRHAVLRELNRGGQMFFVHNRVHDIENLAIRLRQIVPEARIASATVRWPRVSWKT